MTAPLVKDEGPALLDMARRGREDDLEQEMASGAQVDQADHAGRTAYHEAAIYGHVKVCTILLLISGRGADAPDQMGVTPLMLAACTGRLEVFEFLVRAGVTIDTRCQGGRTALHYAAKHGQAEVCAFLIRKGVANLDAKCKAGYTALMLAAEAGCLGACDMLVRGGADLDAQNQRNATALFLAARQGHHQVSTLLATNKRPADVNAVCTGNLTPVHAAAQSGNADTWLLLHMRSNCSVDRSESQGVPPPIVLAAMQGNTEMCETIARWGSQCLHAALAAAEDAGRWATAEKLRALIRSAADGPARVEDLPLQPSLPES